MHLLNRWRSWSIERRFLTVLLAIFLARGVITTFIFPPFGGHDEVAHFAYLDFLDANEAIPVIPDLDDWRSKYSESGNQKIHDLVPEKLYPYCRYFTKDWWHGCSGANYRLSYAINFVIDGEKIYYPSGWIYTANHPPLYYLTMLPVYWLTSSGSVETQLYALRLAAIPFGLITVIFAFMTAKVIFPRERFIIMLAPAFVALQPQIAYESAMLNNDIAAIALTSIVFYFLALGLRQRFPWRICVLTGFTLGLAMLTKNTAVVSAVIIAAATVLGLGIRNWREWIPKGALIAAVAGLLVWPWYLFMWTTYGNLTALDRIKDLQQHWNYAYDNPPTVWSQLTDRQFAWDRWGETWGEYGWRLIPLRDNLLAAILVGCAIGVVGLVWWLVRGKFPGSISVDESTTSTRIAVFVLILVCVVSYFAVLQFGTTFSLTQARYYFPAVNAVAILLALGYRALVPARYLTVAMAGLFLTMIALNLVIYTAYLMPYIDHNL